MANPFSAIDVRFSYVKKEPHVAHAFQVDQQIQLIDMATPRGLRDRVILLLRHKYLLRPSEVSSLNVANVDLSAGVIHLSGRRNPIIIDDGDLPHFRRWYSIRQVYGRADDSFLISLHWTAGRSEPFRRIGVRGLFQIVKKYRIGKHETQ